MRKDEWQKDLAGGERVVRKGIKKWMLYMYCNFPQMMPQEDSERIQSCVSQNIFKKVFQLKSSLQSNAKNYGSVKFYKTCPRSHRDSRVLRGLIVFFAPSRFFSFEQTLLI